MDKKKRARTDIKKKSFFIPSVGAISWAMRRILEGVGYTWLEGKDEKNGKENKHCTVMGHTVAEVECALQTGVERIIVFGGCGPCRYGKILQLIQSHREEQGKEEIVLLEKPNGDWGILLQRLDKICEGKWARFLKEIPRALYFLYHWEKMENLVWDAVATAFRDQDYYAGRRAKELWQEYKKKVKRQKSLQKAIFALKEGEERVKPLQKRKYFMGKVLLRGGLYELEQRSEEIREKLAEQGMKSRRMVPLWKSFLHVGEGKEAWSFRSCSGRKVISLYPPRCLPADRGELWFDLDTFSKERV